MRDRLIEILKHRRHLETSELADVLLASGVIVPPCRVGEVVWGRDVEPQTVMSIEHFSSKVIHLHCISPVTGIRHTFAVGKRSLGKTVFLTREEAEAALKGGAE